MNDENITNASEVYDIVEMIIGVATHDPLSVTNCDKRKGIGTDCKKQESA